MGFEALGLEHETFAVILGLVGAVIAGDATELRSRDLV